MGKYQTTKCGYCGINWAIMSAVDSNIGPPKVKCRNCDEINNTEMYLYRDANWFGKLYYWVSSLINVIIFGGISFVLGIGGLSGKFDSGNLGYVVGLVALVFSLFKFKDVFEIPKSIKNLERIYDKNGGFLWSDEYY